MADWLSTAGTRAVFISLSTVSKRAGADQHHSIDAFLEVKLTCFYQSIDRARADATHDCCFGRAHQLHPMATLFAQPGRDRFARRIVRVRHVSTTISVLLVVFILQSVP